MGDKTRATSAVSRRGVDDRDEMYTASVRPSVSMESSPAGRGQFSGLDGPLARSPSCGLTSIVKRDRDCVEKRRARKLSQKVFWRISMDFYHILQARQVGKKGTRNIRI